MGLEFKLGLFCRDRSTNIEHWVCQIFIVYLRRVVLMMVFIDLLKGRGRDRLGLLERGGIR